MKSKNMEQEFDTMPELPDDFQDVCFEKFINPRIYYKREKKIAKCVCGNCGAGFLKGQIKREMRPQDYEIPKKGETGTCPICGNEGEYEWDRVTHRFYSSYTMLLIQRTTENNLVARTFNVSQDYSQRGARRENTEIRRIFFHEGYVYKFYQSYSYGKHGRDREWGTSSGGETYIQDVIYPGWEKEIKDSSFRYHFDICKEAFGTHGWRLIDALEMCANNPAVEMYQKAGMCELVKFLITKSGKTKYINRRAKNPLKQFRIADKGMLNRLIEEKGNLEMLKLLQMETKTGERYTPEQERFVMNIWRTWKGEESMKVLLKYMSVRKLMNRVDRYRQGEQKDYQVVNKYRDYIQMREELGYDMQNDVFIFPKNLEEKHAEMVQEKNRRSDELYIQKMKRRFADINKKFEKLNEKYGYEKDGLTIRPARDAEEIVMEGRRQHHCVGREVYLDKHNKGESYILLLRKADSPDIPYYTIEIRKNKVIQAYGKFDKKPDWEMVEEWLDEYTKHLRKKKTRKTA